jgi:hypothetical protein
MLEDHVRGGERRVAAQVDLDRGREPAQAVARALGNEERGLAQVVLGRDRLHEPVVEPGAERHDAGRIAGERPIAEGVDPVEWQLHAVLAKWPARPATPGTSCRALSQARIARLRSGPHA